MRELFHVIVNRISSPLLSLVIARSVSDEAISKRDESLRGVYPERDSSVALLLQNDRKRRTQDDILNELATPEPTLSGGEILRLRLRMTGSEGARNGIRGIAHDDIRETARNDIRGSARNDARDYRTFPLASEANMPPKQRTAKMVNDVLMLSRKNG